MAANNNVTIFPQLTDTNFKNWKFRVTTLLDEKGFKETIEDDWKPDTNEKKSMDKKAMNVIINCVTDRHIDYIRGAESAKGMMKSLSNVFERKSTISKLLVRKKLLTLKCTTSLQDHFNKFDALVKDLESMGSKMAEDDQVCHLLLTLPDKYEHIVTVLEAMDTELTVDFVKSRLLDAELKMNMQGTVIDEASFISRPKSGHSVRKCFECGDTRHLVAKCPKLKFKSSSKQNNANYNKVGNRENRSSNDNNNRHRPFDNNNQPRRGYCCETEEKEIVFVAVENSVKNAVFSGRNLSDLQVRFVLDSGCTDHLVRAEMRQYMSGIVELKPPIRINVANGESLLAKEKGILHVTNNQVKIRLEAFVVPNLTLNLLSVKKIVESGKEVIFRNDKTMIVHNNNNIIEGQLCGKLYILNLFINVEKCNIANDLNLWHRRLGHLGRKGLQEMGLPYSKDVCDSCRQGKAVRLPFNPSVEPKSSRIGEFIHTDISGPVTPATINGEKYFQVVLDDFSHFCVVYLLKSKDEATYNLINYIKESETKFGPVCRIRCDNGGEFSNKIIQKFCQDKGIRIEYTAPYSPQMNGRTERMNGTLLNKVRTMFIDTGLPKILWGEAIRTAAFQLNRSPTAALKGGIPAKIYHGKLDLEKLRVFGAKAWALQLPKKGKLEPRAKPTIFIGYASNGYRLWDPEANTIQISRDVTFDENNIKYSDWNTTDKTPIRVITEENSEPEEKEQAMQDENSDEEPFHGFEDDEEKEAREKIRRETQLPKRFDDYELYSAYCLLAGDPSSYSEAVKSGEGWNKAIETELEALEKFETWEPAKLPEGVKPIDTKWVFTTKQNGLKKARLVARGFQEECTYDVYSPVAKMSTVRMMLSFALNKNYLTRQLDIPTAFLNGELEQDIYIKTPEGVDSDSPVLKLRKALYGLKEAPRSWNRKFHEFVTKNGLIRSSCDVCLYSGRNLWLVLFVDDILLVGKKEELSNFTSLLKGEFNAKDLGEINCYLGANISRNKEEIKISQKTMISALLDRFNMSDCKGVSTPLASDGLPQGDGKVIHVPYRQLIGGLMYLCMISRPDIMFATSYLSRFLDRPNPSLWKSAKRILRYLNQTKDFKLVFKKNPSLDIIAYSDADWAGDRRDRKSTSGTAVYFGGNLISWKSVKQQSVALSTAEAEYVAAAQTAAEVIHLHNLARSVSVSASDKVPLIKVDNKSAIFMLSNYENSKRSKHIDIKVNFIKDLIANNKIKIEYVQSENNIADILTKGLVAQRFEFLREKLSIL